MTTTGVCSTRILLVDDHPAIRAHVRELLLSYPFPKEVVCVGTGEDGLALATTEAFQLMLLDLRLPGRGGLEVLKELRQVRPFLPVIIMSSLPELPYANLARRAGAQGFLSKTSLPEGLENAVRFVLGEALFVSHHRLSSAKREKRLG
jgi:DNA-binding NarL/FixJ family response regulator